ncbi:YfiR family protein [Marinobacter sp.]|uniref:YfiR family protein n=1 Tax=Marinobacter sp. TaxID=50741 RepID=UPI0035626709
MLRVVIFALLLAAHDVLAQAEVSSEAEIKAAYLYNFTRFVEWKTPPETSNLSLCVLDDKEVWDAIQPIRGRSAQGRTISLSLIDQIEQSDACQVMFVNSSAPRELSEIAERAISKGILTVSDMKGFIDSGGVIGYVKQGNVIKFEINLKAAKDAGLLINSRLLELAVRVLR